MATDRFEYRRLTGVVSQAHVEAVLNLAATSEPGLAVAECPICQGVLACRLLPGKLWDLFCRDGCHAAKVAVAVKDRAEVGR